MNWGSENMRMNLMIFFLKTYGPESPKLVTLLTTKFTEMWLVNKIIYYHFFCKQQKYLEVDLFIFLAN